MFTNFISDGLIYDQTSFGSYNYSTYRSLVSIREIDEEKKLIRISMNGTISTIIHMLGSSLSSSTTVVPKLFSLESHFKQINGNPDNNNFNLQRRKVFRDCVIVDTKFELSTTNNVSSLNSSGFSTSPTYLFFTLRYNSTENLPTVTAYPTFSSVSGFNSNYKISGSSNESLTFYNTPSTTGYLSIDSRALSGFRVNIKTPFVINPTNTAYVPSTRSSKKVEFKFELYHRYRDDYYSVGNFGFPVAVNNDLFSSFNNLNPLANTFKLKYSMSGSTAYGSPFSSVQFNSIVYKGDGVFASEPAPNTVNNITYNAVEL